MADQTDLGLVYVQALINAQRQFPGSPDYLQRPATVNAYDSTTKIATVRIAGDSKDSDVPVLGGSASVGDRVMMTFQKPQGMFIGSGGASTGVGPAGPPGDPGAPGAPGSPGADGHSVLNGHGAPSGGTGSNGDFYIDVDTETIYGPKTGGSWGSGTPLRSPLNRTFAFFMSG